MQNALGYVMDLGSFSSVEWTDITSGFQMPENAGTWYLSSEGECRWICTDCLPIQALSRRLRRQRQRLQCILMMVRNWKKDRVASGDRFRFAFTMTESEALGMTHLQYLTSVSSLTGDNLHMADEWKSYTDTPVQSSTCWCG